MDLKGRIKYLIVKADLSKRGLAEILKVSPSTVGYWISDKGEPKIPNQKTLKAISDYFNIEYEWLLNGVGNKPENIKIPEKNKQNKTYSEENDKISHSHEDIKVYSCPECINKQKEIDRLIEKCELQQKLIYEYEIQLGKKGKVNCG
jgi:transcriptional regulator with XRE-family HTH domain